MSRVLLLILAISVLNVCSTPLLENLLSFTMKVASKVDSFDIKLNGRTTLMSKDVIDVMESTPSEKLLKQMSEVIVNLLDQIKEVEKNLPQKFKHITEFMGENFQLSAELQKTLARLDDYSVLIDNNFANLKDIAHLLSTGEDYSMYADEAVISVLQTLLYKMFATVNPNQIDKKFDVNIFTSLSDHVLKNPNQLCRNESAVAFTKQLFHMYEFISLVDLEGFYTLKFVQQLYSHYTEVAYKTESDKISSDFKERRLGYESAISFAMNDISKKHRNYC